LSARRIEMAKAELLEKSLVKEVRLGIGRHAPVEFLEPTKQALSLLSKAGHKMNLWLHIGNVGLEHVHYQVRVAYALRALGHQAFIEKRVSGSRRVDVLAIRDGRKMGIEVELHDFELADKLRDAEQVDELVILVKDFESTRHDMARSRISVSNPKGYGPGEI